MASQIEARTSHRVPYRVDKPMGSKGTFPIAMAGDVERNRAISKISHSSEV